MKKILLTLLALVVFLVVAVIVFLLTFNLNHYRHFVETQASNALGRTVEIKSLETKLSLIPTIKVEGVRILDNVQKEPILEIPKLEAVIELMPLIQKQIIVQEIKVPEAVFAWTGAPTSKTSTQEKSEKTDLKAPAKQSKIWIDSVAIDALQCKIGKENPSVFKINKFTLKELSKFSFDFIYQNKTINVSGNFGSILDLATQRAELPINLTLLQEKASLKINGKIADLANLKKMNLKINATIPNLSTFLKNWNVKNDKIPTSTLTFKTTFDGDLDKAELRDTSFSFDKSDFVFSTQGTLTKLKENPSASLTGNLSLGNGSISKLWGIKPFDLETKITATKNGVSLSGIQLNAGRSDLKGNLQVGWENRPVSVKGKLESTYFDIYDILEASKEGANVQNHAANKTKIFSTNKLPFDLLNLVDADLQLYIGHFKFSGEISDYAAVNTTILTKNGDLAMPAQIKLFGGTIQNQLKIQANKKSVALKTEAANIQLDKMKRLSKDIQNSKLNFVLSLEGIGETVHQLAASLQGNISAELTSGQIINKWFNTLPTTLNLLRGRGNTLTFSTQDQKTELLCGAINLPVRNGVIVSHNQIALETDVLNFILNGRIDLKNETLNLTMIPSISKTRGMANELLNVAQSITLSGPLNAIETNINKGVAVENLVQLAAQKLTENDEEKEEKTPSVPAKQLCQKVLGRALISSTNVTQVAPKKKEVKPTKTPDKEEPDLKNQLIQSLSQVLTTPKKQ